MVADLDDHRDGFGIAGLGDRRRVGLGSEFPGVAVAQNRNRNSVGNAAVDFELSSCHRNEFGFGLGGLAHDRGFLGTGLSAASGCRFGGRLSRGSVEVMPWAMGGYLAAPTRLRPTIS